ncbi:MAG: Rv1535 family protein [Mycobacterium sp.]
MTAALYDDAAPTPVPAPIPAPAPKQVRRPGPRHFGGGDPLVDAATRLLSIPLHQVYAVLWRVGLIEVTA